MKTADVTAEIVNLRSILKGFTSRFTHDQEESHDLVQETLLKALMYKSRFRESTNLKGWLFTIMKNTFINQYRRSQRARTAHDNSKESYYLNIEDNHTFSSPASMYEYEDIWRHVNLIKEEFLIPFKLHASGYKYNEIAEHLNLPIGTVKNRIFHARKEIQRRLAGY